MIDGCGRNIDYLRISVTDRCNLRCVYCMPEEGIKNIKHNDILTFKEILMIVKVVSQLGIRKIKITGGEPLVRKGIVNLIRSIKAVEGIEEVTMTTNGVLLGDMAEDLKAAGLNSVNISVDTLNSTSFCKITRKDCFEKVMHGLNKALELGLKTKINCVPIEELNGSDLIDVLKIAEEYPVDIRFIELMPIGFGKSYSPVSNKELYDEIQKNFGTFTPSKTKHGNGPAVYYRIPGFEGSIGFISAMHGKFCNTCNRIRLTSTGDLKPCLCYGDIYPLKELLKSGTDDEIREQIKHAIENKPAAHCFEKPGEITEAHQMAQIGG